WPPKSLLTYRFSMIYKIFPIVSFFLLSLTVNNITDTNTNHKTLAANTESTFDTKAETVYASINANNFSMPAIESFKVALQGFYALKANGVVTKDILTLVDFGLSSKVKRLWVID